MIYKNILYISLGEILLFQTLYADLKQEYKQTYLTFMTDNTTTQSSSNTNDTESDDTNSNTNKTESNNKSYRLNAVNVIDKSSSNKLNPNTNKSVTTLTKEDLENKGYQNLEQALEQTPSITFVSGGSGSKEIDIRGQGVDVSRAVKVLLNGVTINQNDNGFGYGSSSTSAISGVNPFNLIAIDDVESIDIIPGGGAVVYGSGTRGGVINIITKKPSKDYLRFSLRGNSYEIANRLGGELNMSGGKVITDKLFLNTSINFTHQNGLRDKEYSTNAYVSTQAIYQINENQKLDFGLNYSWRKSYFAGYNTRNDGTRWKSFEEMRAERYRSPENGNNNGATEQNLVSTSLKYDYAILENLHLETLLYDTFSNFTYPEVSGSLSTSVASENTSQKAGLDIKIHHKIGNNKLLVGLNGEFNTSNRNAGSNDKHNATTFLAALYTVDSYHFTDLFNLTGGLRGEVLYYDVNRTSYLLTYSGSSYTTGTQQTALKDTRLNYAAELTPNFNYNDTGSIYIKGEVGFISPQAGQMVFAVTSGGNDPGDIKPETYYSAEIGLKDEFTYSTLQTAIYYTHSFNEIRYIYQGAVRNFYNIGETQRIGFELNTKQKFFAQRLVLTESFSLNYSNVLKGSSNLASISGTTGTYPHTPSDEGKRVPYVPLMKASILATLKALDRGNHKLSIFFNNTYFGEQYDNRYNIMNKGGYVLCDFGASYQYKNFTLNFGVRNLYNTFYLAYQAASTNSDLNSTTATTINYLAGEGRNYFVEGKYVF